MNVPEKAGALTNTDTNISVKETGFILLPANHLLIIGGPLLIMGEPYEHQEGILVLPHGHKYHTCNPTHI